MRFKTVLTRVFFIVMSPIFIFSQSESEVTYNEIPLEENVSIPSLLQNYEVLTFESILKLLQDLESGTLQKSCTLKDYMKISKLLTYLTKEGLLTDDPKEQKELENEIEDLLIDETKIIGIFIENIESLSKKEYIESVLFVPEGFEDIHQQMTEFVELCEFIAENEATYGLIPPQSLFLKEFIDDYRHFSKDTLNETSVEEFISHIEWNRFHQIANQILNMAAAKAFP